jgi:hypothetical protein
MQQKANSLEKEAMERAAIFKNLNNAFNKNDLALFLGAGISINSGIPLWDKLVLSIFLNSVNINASDNLGLGAPAISQHWFRRSNVPLEVAAREIRNSFSDDNEFMKWVRFGLYSWMETDRYGNPTLKQQSIYRRNKTLMAIVKLCKKTKPGRTGLSEIITYNFDGLLELMLKTYPCKPIWKQTKTQVGILSIYHVHGYIPVKNPFLIYSNRMGSSPNDSVLTEDQYHKEIENPFSWSNLVQLQALSKSAVLTIGLSLADPNLRRLLDVIRNSPNTPAIYAILKRPKTPLLKEDDMEEIEKLTISATNKYNQFYAGSFQVPDMNSTEWKTNVNKAWDKLAASSFRRQLTVFKELGIHPIWCDNFEKEIPEIINYIIGNS